MQSTILQAAYTEFVEALGAGNVSIDPGIIESYTYMNGLAQGGIGLQWMYRPVAVTLPGSVEDVQAIIEICGKYGLIFKAHSTAWWFMALATCPKTVILDMRRMNNLEIHAEDLYYITEPYVTVGESHIECMRQGVIPHGCGAGPNASNLASATSMQGTGGSGIRTSMNERNVLAVEWITPTGEVLKLGSLNTPGAGWFCGDGPGPSLRGMMRGAVGNNGYNGVFTRVALKLYPWYGPPYEAKGEPPFFDTQEIPNSYLRYVVWSDFEQEADALYQLGEAEIIDYNNRWASGAFTGAMSTSNQEYLEMVKKGDYKEKFGNGFWTFFMHAPSQRAIEYRIKVFEDIVADTGGVIYDTMIFGKRSYEIAIQNAVFGMFIGKAAYMPTSANTGALPMTYETIDQCYKHALPISLAAKEAWTSTNKYLNEGRDNCYVCIDEDGHYVHIEHAALVEPWEPLSEPIGAILLGTANALKNNLGIMYMPLHASPKDMMIYQKQQVKIQQLLDPTGKITNHINLKAFEQLMPEEEI